MAFLSIKIEGLTHAQRRFARAGDQTPGRIRDAMANSVLVVRGLIVRYSPRNFGTLQSKYVGSVRMGPAGIIGKVASPLVQAPVLELGRRAGARMPPLDAIAFWAMRKFGIDEDAAGDAAFPIARAIALRGFKGHPHGWQMAKRATREGRPKVIEIFRRVLRAV